MGLNPLPPEEIVAWSAPWIQGWKKPMGNLTIHESFVEGELCRFPHETTIWICNPSANFVIRRGVLDRFPMLRCIITPSTGNNHIDVGEMNTMGITVLSLLDDRAELNMITASSEFTFLMILAGLRRLDHAIVYSTWERDEKMMRGHELQGKQVGIVGMGRIGKNVSRWCKAFGATIMSVDIGNQEDLPQLFKTSNVVVICCTLNNKTRGFITLDYLRKMKEDAVIVNTSRGEVFASNQLEWILTQRHDITACLDVLPGEVEGKQGNSILLSMDNVIITPHVAGTTAESQEKAMRIAFGLLEKYHEENVGSGKGKSKKV
jgi:D-3-phosphoglycerate dehydrogenase / 2-oxoglutarate reductase